MTKREHILAAYRAGSDLIGRVAFLLLMLVAARRLSTDSFGLFMLGTTLGWLAAVTSDFGMQMHVGRAVAQQPQRASELLARWFTSRVVSSLVAFFAAVVLVAIDWVPSAAAATLVLLTAVSLVTGMVEFLHYVYRALGRTDVESSITLGLRGGSLACGLLVLWWRPDVTWLAAALLIAPTVSLVFSLRFARRLAAHATQEGAATSTALSGWYSEPLRTTVSVPSRSTDEPQPATAGADSSAPKRDWRHQAREFGSDVAPVGIGILLSALYFRIDAFLIEHWRGIEAVALYSAVFRIVDALRLFPGAVLAVALPTLCRATGFRVVRTLAVQLTLGAMAGASILWLVAPWLVPMLFGPAYAPAATTFRILLTAFPLMTLNYALTQQLVAWNGNRAFAACCAGALGVNLTINARAIPAWSIEGAAWATLATEIALTISCLGALVKRRRRLAGRGQTPHGLRGTENSPETAEARRKTGEFPLLRDSDSGAGSVFRSPERLRHGLLENRWRQVGATWQEW